MLCLKCGTDSPDVLKFRVLEVHTLHIRDFSGERIIQALGESNEYEICTACASEEVQALLLPAGRIVRMCLPFVLLGTVGAVLSVLLTFGDFMPAIRVIGPLAVIVGVIGTAGKIRDILRERESVSKMNHDEAVRYSAWQLLLRYAPKKFGDNDITYIPVSKDTLNMTPSLLAENYDLLPSISVKAHEIMHEGE